MEKITKELESIKKIIKASEYSNVDMGKLIDDSKDSSHKGLLTWYTAPLDSFFARGWIGFGYALWLIIIGIVALLQVTFVLTQRFTVPLVLVCLEFVVTIIGTIFLSFLVARAQKSVSRLRRRGSKNEFVSLKVLSDMARARFNCNNDFDLLSSGIVWSLIEVTIACVIVTGATLSGVDRLDANGNPIVTLYLHKNNTSTYYNDANVLLSSALTPDVFATQHLVFALQLFILIKVAVQLGRALSRHYALGLHDRLTRLYAEVDAQIAAGTVESEYNAEKIGVTDPVTRVNLSNTFIDIVA